MKKLRFLLFATLVAGSANAQYFQHVYGAQSQDFLESGVNKFLTGPQGHIMTGYSDITGFNNAVQITSTDMNGNIPPFFNNFYQIGNSAMLVSAKGRRVAEIDPNTIGVWGDYSDNSSGVSNKFFFMAVDPTGVPIPPFFPKSYTLTMNVAEAEATSLTVSPAMNGIVYMCGFVRHVPGGVRYPIVMCINALTGVFVWGFEYQVTNMPNADWAAMDLVESPYPDPNHPNIPNVAVAGQITAGNSAQDGCFFELNSSNGTVSGIGAVVTYGTVNFVEGFNAIDIALNSYGGSKGFVMGGYGFNPASGTDDSWALKTNTNGSVVHFSNYHDYSLGGRNDYGNDIIERVNLSGAYEYYLGGYVDNGVFGNRDALVYKLDFKGNADPNGQFTYGGHGDDQCQQLDQYNNLGPNNDGLSVYGNTVNSFPLLGQNDFYLVKTYFNGVTACNYDVQPYPYSPGPVINRAWRYLIAVKMVENPLFVYNYQPMNDWEICWSQALADGDNSRHAAATENAITAPGYFPNPVSHDNAVVTVTFGKAAVEGEAELELWNSLGQLCWSKKAAVADGQIQMEVQLGNELSGGMYHLIVKQNGTVNNYRIVVQ